MSNLSYRKLPREDSHLAFGFLEPMLLLFEQLALQEHVKYTLKICECQVYFTEIYQKGELF